MDRPRFQVDIGTMMVGVVVAGLVLGLGLHANILFSALAITFGTNKLYLMRARARRGAEEREWSGAEERSAEREAFGLTLGLLVLLAIAFLNRR